MDRGVDGCNVPLFVRPTQTYVSGYRCCRVVVGTGGRRLVDAECPVDTLH